MKPVTLLAVLAAVTGCSTNAMQAPDSAAHPSQAVRYDDLDLTESAQARILYERIANAASELCGPVDPHDVAQIWVRPCVQRAVAKAVDSVNEPMLTTIHSREGPDDRACRQEERRVVIPPHGGHPGKGTQVPRFETRTVTVCGDETTRSHSAAKKNHLRD